MAPRAGPSGTDESGTPGSAFPTARCPSNPGNRSQGSAEQGAASRLYATRGPGLCVDAATLSVAPADPAGAADARAVGEPSDRPLNTKRPAPVREERRSKFPVRIGPRGKRIEVVRERVVRIPQIHVLDIGFPLYP